jgi:hypothetical protein
MTPSAILTHRIRASGICPMAFAPTRSARPGACGIWFRRSCASFRPDFPLSHNSSKNQIPSRCADCLTDLFQRVKPNQTSPKHAPADDRHADKRDCRGYECMTYVLCVHARRFHAAIISSRPPRCHPVEAPHPPAWRDGGASYRAVAHALTVTSLAGVHCWRVTRDSMAVIPRS